MLRFIREFEADWALGGRSPRTAKTYIKQLRPLLEQFAAECDNQADLAAIKTWIAEHPGAQTRRLRGRAARAFFGWGDREGAFDAPRWKRIPLTTIEEMPRRTATEGDYRAVLARCTTPRDRALVGVLWSSGMRCAEISRMRIEDLDLVGMHVLVPVTRPSARRALRGEACPVVLACTTCSPLKDRRSTAHRIRPDVSRTAPVDALLSVDGGQCPGVQGAAACVLESDEGDVAEER